MKKMFIVFFFIFAIISCKTSLSAGVTSCASYSNGICTYSPSSAVNYARNYALTDTAFPKYQAFGGNCTNYVSQSILAGLVGSSDKYQVYNKRAYYMADRDKGCTYCWYYDTGTSRGYSWTGAHELYQYAKSNLNSYWGMHFNLVTFDSKTQALDTTKVQTGDVIFADWTGNGTIDHSMIVTQKTSNSYSGIFVSYQNSEGYASRLDRALSAINSVSTVFYVYRPTFYRN
jgi:hypothetical protein